MGPHQPHSDLDTDEKLKADNWAAGLDVWENVQDAYIEEYLRGDARLGNAQLWSLKQAIIREALAPVAQFIDSDPCRLDHHGYCQVHAFLHDGPCPVGRVQQMMTEVGIDLS